MPENKMLAGKSRTLEGDLGWQAPNPKRISLLALDS